MRAWLRGAETLREQGASARSARLRVASLAEERTRHREALVRAAAVEGAAAPPDGEALEPVLAHCEGVIRQAEERAARRSEVAAGVGRATERQERAERRREDAGGAHELWAEAWRTCMAELGLRADGDIGAATALVDGAVELVQRVDERRGKLDRLDALARVAEEFADEVRAAAASVGVAVGDGTPEQVATELQERLTAARDTRTRVRELEARVEELESELAVDRDRQAGLDARRDALRAEAGAAETGEVAAVVRRWREARRLTERLGLLEQQLLQSGDGLGLAELEAEVEGQDLDEVPEAIERVDARLGTTGEELQRLYVEEGRLRAEQAAMDGSDAAAGAAERASEIAAQIGHDAAQYLRLRAAGLILDQEIERYRKANQAPVLARASALFERLTGGSFAGLRDDLDAGGRPVLRGVRHDGAEVGPDGMSEGTRDQLFLALRLATLERQLDGMEPVPFVVDDILVGFDDGRALAALEVLAELAGRTQVLLFTHHRRVVELAETVRSRAGVFVHELPGPV
jgi:uncharacterized protein YhaN